MKHFILTATLSLGMATSAFAAVADYTSFWVLGDSLSDNGNVFEATDGATPAAPYFDGRFSDGPVWNEAILQDFTDTGRPNGNFAFGGARTVGGDVPTLAEQQGLLQLNAAPAFGDNPLVSLWFGGNDLFAAIDAGGDPTNAAREAANAVTDAAQTLSGQGVDDFVIFNLPSLDKAPAYNLFQRDKIDDALAASEAFNSQLASNIAGLKDQGLTVFDIDVNGLINSVLADPTSFGFDSIALPCVFPTEGAATAFGQPQVCDPASLDGKLFFDSIHPTAKAHALVTGIVRDTIDGPVITPSPVPLPASVWLMIAGLGGLGIARTRRAA